MKIGIVGLGYVGLPLSVCFSKKFQVCGFDTNQHRIRELLDGNDRNGESSREELISRNLQWSSNPGDLRECQVVVVTVPTPVDSHNKPDLSCVENATKTVGRNLSQGTIVVYESTVYPGVTEDICVPILEKESQLTWKKNFHVGYSPERINPGDRLHAVESIKKVVAGDTIETTQRLAEIYGSVIKAGVYCADSIKVAEAAKVIENTQRDLNIALINELAIIFNKLGISTHSVLEAASTKWNFLNFSPGLVGGHCIGVDPYYLTYKAQEIGYLPEVILAGRRVNDGMGRYIAAQTIKHLLRQKQNSNPKILICGFTFKENVRDVRNTRVHDIIKELSAYGMEIYVYDPLADVDEVKKEYNISLISNVYDYQPYGAVIMAVKHEELLKNLTPNKLPQTNIVLDVKGFFKREDIESQNIVYWRL